MQILLFSLITWAMHSWGEKYLLFYYIGVVIALILIVSKLNLIINNSANVKEYFEGLAQFTGEDKFKAMDLKVLET